MAPTSTRWCPTQEQVMILEEMYRNGVRTPNATQIQQIATHLSFYGKIEGKNVFYWFQNHKARDRQKLRKKLSKQLQLQQQQQLLQYHHMQQNRHLVHYLDSPPLSPAFSFINPNTTFLPRAIPIVEDQEGKKQVVNYTWKQLDNMIVQDNKSNMITSTYGGDWLMMVDVGPTLPPSCCNKRPPLKTLDLFPVTSSNLKEEESNSSCSIKQQENPCPCSVWKITYCLA